MTDNPHGLNPHTQRPTEPRRGALLEWMSTHCCHIIRWAENPEVEFSVHSDVQLSATREVLDHQFVDAITGALDQLGAETLLRHQIPLQLRERRSSRSCSSSGSPSSHRSGSCTTAGSFGPVILDRTRSHIRQSRRGRP